MKILLITPGTGNYYSGTSIRDNALATALQTAGHETTILPVHLPVKIDEAPASTNQPILFSIVNTFLQQKVPFFRKRIPLIDKLLDNPLVLKLANKLGFITNSDAQNEITFSMLEGLSGNHSKEVIKLISHINKSELPDVIILSSALLSGIINTLKESIPALIVCMFHGENCLDSMDQAARKQAWNLIRDNLKPPSALLIAPSQSYAKLVALRMQIPVNSISIIPNGISLDGYDDAEQEKGEVPVIGYLARMNADKGLEILIDAFIQLRSDYVEDCQLKIMGTSTSKDKVFLTALKNKLTEAELIDDVEFHPNIGRDAKIEILKTLTAFSVPAVCHEEFGLYLLEAMAAGAPVVQPNHASFPEIIEQTGGGMIYEQHSKEALAEALAQVILYPETAQQMSDYGKYYVREQFSIDQMAQALIDLCAPYIETTEE